MVGGVWRAVGRTVVGQSLGDQLSRFEGAWAVTAGHGVRAEACNTLSSAGFPVRLKRTAAPNDRQHYSALHPPHIRIPTHQGLARMPPPAPHARHACRLPCRQSHAAGSQRGGVSGASLTAPTCLSPTTRGGALGAEQWSHRSLHSTRAQDAVGPSQSDSSGRRLHLAAAAATAVLLCSCSAVVSALGPWQSCAVPWQGMPAWADEC